LDERQLFANWPYYFVLDGFHSLGDAVFSDAKKPDTGPGCSPKIRNCYSTW
jgi:hypothetical protein